MNNLECNVARDLMPLCIDQVASEESRAQVDAHVAECAPCAQVYADMQAKMPEKKDVAEETSFAAAMRQLRKTVGWKRIKVIVLSVVITLSLLAVGYGGYVFFIVEYHRAMPLDWYNSAISRTKDGTGLIIIDYTKGYGGNLGAQSDPNTGIILFGSQCPLITLKSDSHMKDSKCTYRPGIHWKDGIGFVFDVEDSAENTSDMVVKEIRMGTKDDYRILYQQGDGVALCSDEMETYIQLEQEAADAQATVDKIYSDLGDFDERLIPEWQ